MKFSNWLALIALLSIGAIIWSLKEIIIQVFAGVVLAMALCTLVGKLQSKFSIKRIYALPLCMLFVFIIISLALIVVVPPFTSEFQELIIQLPNAARKLWEISIQSLEKINQSIYGVYAEDLSEQNYFLSLLNSLPDSSSLATGVADGIRKILGVAGNLGSGVIQLIFILSVGLMISVQPRAYREVSILLIPSFYRKRARIILQKCGDALSSWMVGVFISSLCVALLAGIGLSLLGVKLVIANALLAGMLNIIPNVGPVISTLFPMSIALLDDPWKALAVLCMYIFIQNLESYIITPSVMHYQVKLLPGLTLIAQFVFTIMFGPMGLLLALPLAVVMQVLIKEVVIHDLLDPWKKRGLRK